MLAANDPKRVVGMSPTAVRMLAVAAKAISEQRLAQADAAFVGVLALAPTHPEVLRLLGVLRHLQRRPVEAIDALRSAADARTGDALIHNNLGSALRGNREIDAAIDEFRLACKLAPRFDAAWFNLGKCLKSESRMDEAHEALEQCMCIKPEHAGARIALAEVLKAKGEIEAAQTMYVSVTRLPLQAARAWFGLANLKTVAFSKDDIRAMERFAAACVDEDQRIELGFALAKAYDDSGEYEKSFAVLVDANARKRRRVEWDRHAFHQLTQGQMIADQEASAVAAQSLGSEVIFVMSLPRSGSTLTEQILAAHPKVEGAGELTHLPDILAEESTRLGKPLQQWMLDADADDWKRLGQEYLARTARWRQNKLISTDKGLNNWYHGAAARRMLPAARMVWCRRDPVETVFACFRQLFALGQNFSYDIDDLVAYWRDYDQFVSQMVERHGDTCHESVYEHLVAAPEDETCRLLDACGLAFDERCLRFHESGRHVRTASAAQVRQPLRSDTARAPVYGHLLDPIRAALTAQP